MKRLPGGKKKMIRIKHKGGQNVYQYGGTFVWGNKNK